MQARFISKFSIWESEVQAFLKNVDRIKTIDKQELTNWFYGEAVLIFQKAAQTAHRTKPSGVEITAEDIANNKIAGFKAILDGLINKFSKDNVELSKSITEFYKEFQEKAISNHTLDYMIQARVTNNLTGYMKTHPAIKREDVAAKLEELFLTEKNKLADDIDAQLQFTREFFQQAQPQQAATQPSPRAALSLHQPAAKKPETLRLKHSNEYESWVNDACTVSRSP